MRKESDKRFEDFQEEQRRILEDPHASQEEKLFARKCLGLEEEAAPL